MSKGKNFPWKEYLDLSSMGTETMAIASSKPLKLSPSTQLAKMNSFVKRLIHNSATNSTLEATKERSQCNCATSAIAENIATLCRDGYLTDAMNVFHHVKNQGIDAVDVNIYAYLLQACANKESVEDGKYLHTHIIKNGFQQNAFMGSKLVNMYANCVRILDARLVFDRLTEPDVFSWNWMIRGYAKNGHCEQALALCSHMRRKCIQVDTFAIPFVLNACARLRSLKQGKEVHSHIIRSGFESDVFVCSSLIDMYAKCGNEDFARNVFDKMPLRNLVSWNTMIAGYAQNGNFDEALKLFQKMQMAFMKPNTVTWNAIIAGYVQNGHADEALQLLRQMQGVGVKPNSVTISSVLPACASLEFGQLGKQIHGYAARNEISSDVFVGSALIDMYVKLWSVEVARQVFDNMCQRNVVSWNTMIAGYAQTGDANEALKIFFQMQLAGLKPNSISVASVLPACGQLSALQQGKEIHDYAIRIGLESVVFVGNALVDMYCKCGNIEFAQQVFRRITQKDLVSWTTMVVGYGMHGKAMEAFTYFNQMQQAGLKPNYITFIGVLSACSHAGLVEEGWQYFNSMYRDHFIIPGVEHYACMVDILGRAGCLDEAYNFVKNMPLKPSSTVWGALLAACRVHHNLDPGEHVAECLLELEPENPGNYILLSNFYAQAGRWHDVAKVRTKMKVKGLKKNPGCSWINAGNKIHTFVVGDTSHPQLEKIYATLDLLAGQMKEAGYVPDTNFILQDV